MTLKFKACPKCQGDLQVRRDVYGMFINCIQCGLQRDLDAPNAAMSSPTRKRRSPGRRRPENCCERRKPTTIAGPKSGAGLKPAPTF